MDAIVHHPEGCCHAQLMEEIEAIRELRAELDGFVRSVMLAKQIVDGASKRARPAPRRQPGRLVEFPARTAVS